MAYLQLKHNFYALLRILAVGKRVSFFSDFFHTLFFRLSQKTFKCRLLWTSCLFKKIAFLQTFRTWKFNILSICGKMLKNHSKYHYGLGNSIIGLLVLWLSTAKFTMLFGGVFWNLSNIRWIVSAKIVNNFQTFKRQLHKMVKHTQAIRRQQPMNFMSMFDHFVVLALKGLTFSH